MKIDTNTDGLTVSSWGSTCAFTWGWLRDHCDDHNSEDVATGQRRVDTFGHETPGAPEVMFGETAVAFRWPGGGESSISNARLVHATRASGGRRLDVGSAVSLPPDISPWDGDHPLQQRPPLEFASLEPSEFLTRLHEDGFVVLEGVDAGEKSVEAIVALVGYVRTTIFGGVWELAADLTGHFDSAYSTTFLGPHTDGTYMHDAPGLQLFVCQERAGTGGASILVDGFAAVDRLQRADPDAVACLSSLDVVGRYLEPGVHLEAARPAVSVDRHGVMQQVSFNNYDRAPFHHGSSDPAFRAAYAALGGEIAVERHWHHVEWQAGRALVFDNWRLLHGRTSYTGSRRFLGAYVNHEDVESALRVLAADAP